MSYRIEFRPGARRDLKRLPLFVIPRIDAAILALQDQPRPIGCKKMVGYSDRYRIRVGRYRIIYEIHDDAVLVLVLHVGHRREVYRDN